MTAQLLIGTRKGLFGLNREGGARRITHTSFLGDHVSAMLRDPRDGAWYAALYLGHFGAKLHRSTNEGRDWQEIAVPEYPPQPEDQVEVDGFGRPWSWKMNMIWVLEASHASRPGLLWCGTIPGGLFVSRDSGASWQLVSSLWEHPKRKEWFGGGADLPGIHSICVHPADPSHVTLGVSCGGVWLTRDEGQSWQCAAQGMYAEFMPPEKKYDPNIQDPHRVVQCRARPEVLWAQHHNGVFRTTNGCESWHDVPNVPPSVFGFAVSVHPHDADTAWLVPAIKDEKRVPVDGKFVVSRTRDGGKSFTVLTEGLPQEHAYDIAYRHALDIDAQGQTLALGTTTGSLWLSDDQGDRWQAVSEHLPPIYCVRFLDR